MDSGGQAGPVRRISEPSTDNIFRDSFRPYLRPDQSPDETAQNFLERAAKWFDENGAFAHIQGTRPQTVDFALNDSPAGLPHGS